MDDSKFETEVKGLRFRAQQITANPEPCKRCRRMTGARFRHLPCCEACLNELYERHSDEDLIEAEIRGESLR